MWLTTSTARYSMAVAAIPMQYLQRCKHIRYRDNVPRQCTLARFFLLSMVVAWINLISVGSMPPSNQQNHAFTLSLSLSLCFPPLVTICIEGTSKGSSISLYLSQHQCIQRVPPIGSSKSLSLPRHDYMPLSLNTTACMPYTRTIYSEKAFCKQRRFAYIFYVAH